MVGLYSRHYNSIKKKRFNFKGFEIRISSTVPVGSGLSSSAALEISLLRAIRRLFQLKLDDVEIARLGQEAENDFVGAKVGIMDQMVCSLGQQGTALFLDTRTLRYENIPFPAHCDIGVINSGISHSHVTGGYNRRRQECSQAAIELDVPVLSVLSVNDLQTIERLADPLSKRARHVITENERVISALQAIRTGDCGKLGVLFSESHRSMRFDFEVSTPEIDWLVENIEKEKGVFGARMTGGGFGGSVLFLAQKGTARTTAENVMKSYQEQFRLSSSILLPL